MNIVRQVSGADYIQSAGGFTGIGVRAEVMDGAITTTHQEFTPTPLIHGGTGGGDIRHGNATYGIVFADGSGNGNARGLLPDAERGIFAYRAGYGGDRYAHTSQLLQSPYFAVFQSNSWGTGYSTAYTSISAEMDDILFNYDVLLCQSQSNQGDQSSRPEAWAKNILSIGGVRTFDNLDQSHHEWCESIMNCCNIDCPPNTCCSDTCPRCLEDPQFCEGLCDLGCPSCGNDFCASRGPAPDGRVKPDLTHFADCVFTTYTYSTYGYNELGGTSAATPITCGYAGLVFQMWHEGVFNVWNGTTSVPTGTPGGTVFSDRAHSTTVKAMLINTAYRYPLDTEPPLYRPDFTRDNMGWGIVDVAALYEQRDNMFVVNETDVLSLFQTRSYTYVVPTGSPALRVTMVYADPPEIPNSTSNLVNDLSIKVTSPSGAVYWGNLGLVCVVCLDDEFVGNWSIVDPNPSTPDKDFINNVENVFIKNPQAGNWTITVSADAINQGNHVDYALVASSGDRPRGRCCQTVCEPSYSCTCSSWTARAACTGFGATWTSDATCADDCSDSCITCPE